jgi:hypothetical protein
MKRIGFQKTVFKEELDKLLESFKKVDFKKIYLSEDSIKNNNSYTFNSVFIIDNLGLDKTIKKQTIKLFKKIYLKNDGNLKHELSVSEFKSFIYSLTHIIISESKYYQRWVRNFGWILDLFTKNFDNIIRNTTLDIVTEVALCFKLCRQEKKYENVYQGFLNYTKKEFEFSRIKTDMKFLAKKEHTSSLLVILYSKIDKFYSGPNLSSLQRLYQKTFYDRKK